MGVRHVGRNGEGSALVFRSPVRGIKIEFQGVNPLLTFSLISSRDSGRRCRAGTYLSVLY
jgi:hypothetical protein